MAATMPFEWLLQQVVSSFVVYHSTILFIRNACYFHAAMVTTYTGGVMGFSDGTLSNGQFKFLMGIGIDSIGGIYITDKGGSRVRKAESS